MDSEAVRTIENAVVLNDPILFRQAGYINGEWIASGPKGVIAVDDPATGNTIGTVPRFGVAETRAAIDAAAVAFRSWKRETAKTRAAVLRRWFDLMIEHERDLARLMTIEVTQFSRRWHDVRPERETESRITERHPSSRRSLRPYA
jgi:delta 1-pyrroline-5-carboxylate dehydrogenase